MPRITSARVFTVDKNGNQTSQNDYDWVPYNPSSLPDPASMPLLKTVATTYVNATADSADIGVPGTYHYSNWYSGTTPLLLARNLASAVEVRSPSSVVVSRAQYEYDGGTPTVGNLTTERRWDSTKQPQITSEAELGDGNSVKSTFTYSARGNKTLETDPSGKQVSYAYATFAGCSQPECNDTYVTTETRGAAPTQLISTYDYNFYTGIRTTATDPNSVTTTTSLDRYGRPTRLDEGALRTTGIAYDDVLVGVTSFL